MQKDIRSYLKTVPSSSQQSTTGEAKTPSRDGQLDGPSTRSRPGRRSTSQKNDRRSNSLSSLPSSRSSTGKDNGVKQSVSTSSNRSSIRSQSDNRRSTRNSDILSYGTTSSSSSQSSESTGAGAKTLPGGNDPSKKRDIQRGKTIVEKVKSHERPKSTEAKNGLPENDSSNGLDRLSHSRKVGAVKKHHEKLGSTSSLEAPESSRSKEPKTSSSTSDSSNELSRSNVGKSKTRENDGKSCSKSFSSLPEPLAREESTSGVDSSNGVATKKNDEKSSEQSTNEVATTLPTGEGPSNKPGILSRGGERNRRNKQVQYPSLPSEPSTSEEAVILPTDDNLSHGSLDEENSAEKEVSPEENALRRSERKRNVKCGSTVPAQKPTQKKSKKSAFCPTEVLRHGLRGGKKMVLIRFNKTERWIPVENMHPTNRKNTAASLKLLNYYERFLVPCQLV